jgi:formylglycine-generating enzyme required for sulfatase activity/thiol-disulfide isomerase/thioredoxin
VEKSTVAITYFCPKCGHGHVLPEEALGKKIRCKECRTVVRVTDNFVDRPQPALPATPVASEPHAKSRLRLTRLHAAIGSAVLITILLVWVAERTLRREAREIESSPAAASADHERPLSSPAAQADEPSRPEVKPQPTSPTLAVSNESRDAVPTSDQRRESDKPPQVVVNAIGMRLVRIPAGVFQMGSPKTEAGRDGNEELHTVEITKPYFIGQFEVTQKEYETVMGMNPSYFSSTGEGRAEIGKADTSRFPVEWVSHEDAMEFCLKLSCMAEELAGGRVYRLPTEAEWEKACRGGTDGEPFSFGDSLSTKDANINGTVPYGNAPKGGYLKRTTEVGSYAANPSGVFDMHGNVAEWCLDRFDDSFYKYSPRLDPQGPTKSTFCHVVRGGSWFYQGVDARTAKRSVRPLLNDDTSGNFRCNYIGFRVVCLSAATEGSLVHRETAGTGLQPSINRAPQATDDLLRKASDHASRREFERAAELAEQALRQEPHHRLALSRHAQFEAERARELVEGGQREEAGKHFHNAAASLRNLRSSYADLGETERDFASGILYEDCRAYAWAGDSQKALETLREAFTAGYSNLDWAETDPDLRPLRALPEFAPLISQECARLLEREKGIVRTKLNQHPQFTFDFDLPGMDGKKVALSKLRGKVVVVDVWGTWCAYCQQEIPHLVRLKNEYRDRGLEIVGLTFERAPAEEAKRRVREYCKAQKINYPCIIGDGHETILKQIPEFSAYPTTLFLDRNGAVRLKQEGSMARYQLEAVVSVLLAE